jgi:hypothetical protein
MSLAAASGSISLYMGVLFINGVSMLERTGLPPFVAGVWNQLVLGTRR